MEYSSADEMESELNDLLQRVEDETGLDTDVFDEVEVTDNLPSNVPAATKHQKQPYLKVKLYTDPELLTRSWADKGLTLTHETIHGNQMKYKLGSNISDTLNEDQRKFFMKKQSQSRDQMEAGTELLARTLFPQNNYAEQKGYPYLTQKAEEEAKQKGLSIEGLLEDDREEIEGNYQNSAYELADEISDYIEKVEEHYSENPDFSVRDYDISEDLEYLENDHDEYDRPYAEGANFAGTAEAGRNKHTSSINYDPNEN